jgi:hypothetical protein
MPVLRERMPVPTEPVLRLTSADPAEQADAPRPDAMSLALGLRVSASMYEVWSAADLWHMAGGPAKPLAVVSKRVGREVEPREFASAVSSAVNAMLGYDGCRVVRADRIRADGSETVSLIVDELLSKRQGRAMLRRAVAKLGGK